ncbi:MAG: exopolyphosphatase/guanosine-5'-triphosphate,3'-diphosphate pyrophosphatase [Kiritimatiellia bacterium]|jgi:exopolyphosphatase/guanosine-5'-triphosphate,3'-diphosphate pyrophosphatase
MRNTETKNPYFAAIDLGSNSFQLLVVKLNDGVIETIDRVKEMVQIARGLSSNNQLSADAQKRALHCLRCFHERIRDIPAAQVRIAGTKALRSASNAHAFLKQAESALGHSIDIISGYEEARLVYLGVSHDISPDKGRSLVIDIGGASTEFIIGLQQQTQQLESLSIGCVTYSDRFFTHAASINKPASNTLSKHKQGTAPEHISTEMIWKTYYACCIELESITQRYQKTGWDIAVGSSGTMRAIAQLMQEDVVTGIITRSGLSLLLNHLHTQGQLIETANLSPERRNVLPAGIIILSAIFDQFTVDEIHVVDSGLKEGLIFDTINRLSRSYHHHHHNDGGDGGLNSESTKQKNASSGDIRDLTANKMMEQYQVDTTQAEHVDRALSHFGENLSIPVVNGINVKKILHWAAQLHEIGLSISHSGYHHHGHYIIQQSDMAGFSRAEQELLALLIGTHRRKIRSDRLTLLTAENQQMLYPLLVCLRLGVLLNHRREDTIELPTIDFRFIDLQGANISSAPNLEKQGPKKESAKKTPKTLHIALQFPAQWLHEHPLSKHKLSQEQAHLSPLGVILEYS